MKKKTYPYDLDYIKDYLIKKDYKGYITFTQYKKVFKYLYPDLTNYYLQRIIIDLIKEDFLIYEITNNRRHFKVKKDVDKNDIGYMEWC